LEGPHIRALQAILFHVAFWHLDLGYLGPGLHGRWPQNDIGIVLWSLSIAANDWQSSESLTRLCTIPINDVLGREWDTASTAMEARILRPLKWFGLVDYKPVANAGSPLGKQHYYRKTVLFDRFLSFGVRLERASAPRH
jgi:hypothetical protein